jgi:glucose-6-phosphate 1-dehydrogenase
MTHCKKVLTPTSIILLGATGDLAKKKLLPALLDLFVRNALPENFNIIAFSRTQQTTEKYREFVKNHIEAKGKQYEVQQIKTFLSSIEYVQGVFEETASYERIKLALNAYDNKIGMCTSKLFYLAVPPVFYDTIFEQHRMDPYTCRKTVWK